MKKTLKTKIICMLLLFVLLFTMLPVVVFAEVIGDPTDTPEEMLPEDDEGEDGTDGGIEDDADTEEGIDYSDALPVASAAELEAALLEEVDAVLIAADFELDRTFYITSNLIIVSDEAHTLTRAPGFGGDIFVVLAPVAEEGEKASTEQITLYVGKPDDSTPDIITIDGNKDNMTVPVVGSIFYVEGGQRLDLMKNLTVKNAYKSGNERTLTTTKVSYPEKVGGAVSINELKSTVNIYGGKYLNNSTNDIVSTDSGDVEDSTHGGAFYNYGTMNIYGGTFKANHASRGGALYNYRTMNIYCATIEDNTASSLGGAIYVPASTAAYLYIGEENDVVEGSVTFRGNISESNGGAIYAQHVFGLRNASFIGNISTTGHGGAISAGSLEMTAEYCTFDGNKALDGYGGAIYLTGTNKGDERELTVGNSTFSLNTAKRGGALYMSGSSRVYFSVTDIAGNTATDYGGAIYATGSALEMNGVDLSDNSTGGSGGIVYLTSAASALLNDIEADGNSAGKHGGAIYVTAEGTSLDVYNSSFSRNSAESNGGAIYAYTGTLFNSYNVLYEENTSGETGGALYVYTAGESILHTCTFEGNTAATLGGGMYVSGKTQGKFYNLTANGNHADKGGFMYHTAAGTYVHLVGVTLLGNTATTGGPIIWGNTTNAKLYIDKLKYVDNGHTGDWDDAYWSSAIYNLLTVYEVTEDIPAYEDYGTGELIQPPAPIMATDVSTAAQLERALEVGYSLIRITADFELDRTFYVTSDTTIFASVEHTLTRAADFGGDIFVVGMTSAGKRVSGGVTLTLAKGDGTDATLTINGNSENMTVDVLGTVILVYKSSTANLMQSLAVTNNKKVGNERVLSNFTVSYPDTVGGAVAILEDKSTMNIYGGSYTANYAMTEGSVASYGGAFYNYGTLNVYGGTFADNHALRGGAFYNYRRLHIYNATIENNTASTFGGAIYVPNSTVAYTYIGEATDLVPEGTVVFRGNGAVDGGGAIYARNVITIRNTIFEGNSTTTATNGGAIYAGAVRMTIDNTVFRANTSNKYGGVMYVTDTNGLEDSYEVIIRNSVIEGNTATTRAGAIYASGGARIYIANTDITANSSKDGGVFYLNGAYLEMNGCTAQSNNATGSGAVIYALGGAEVLLNNVTAQNNTASTYAGFAYFIEATLSMYNSTVSGNSAQSNGGAIYAKDGAILNLYNTEFSENTSGENGGALFVYTNLTNSVIHSCTFTGNNGASFGGGAYISNKSLVDIYNITGTDNTADKGGFLYITTSGTVVNVAGMTVLGNTATTGGPIIWGNTANAKLYLDKSKYTDLDHTGSYDSAYWKAAVYNKLTWSDKEIDIPKYLDYGNESYDHMADAVDVANAAELEAAIRSGAKHIRIIADFEIDRTFYITGDVTIFTTIGHTLTRADDFDGDMFVVGEDETGKSSLLMGGNASLTLGNPLSTLPDLLVIDGNGINMTVTVVGSVIFMVQSSTVNVYENVSVINCTKLGNERTLSEKYFFSSPGRVGGAFAIVESGTLNIYGGYYADNRLSEEIINGDDESGRVSTIGGLIFNYSNLNIYGGTFERNEAARGGVVYNYRMMRIYGGIFRDNVATVSGGVVYEPNSSQVHLYVGNSGDAAGTVLFEGNRAKTSGGVLYASPLTANVIYGGASFVGNTVTSGSGGAIAMYGQLTVRGSEFSGNSASSRGGAIYASKSTRDNPARYIEITDCLFEANTATLGGALSLYASSSDFEEGAIANVKGCTFTANTASTEVSGASSALGGAIFTERKVKLNVYESEFSANTASTEGGALYVAGESEAVIEKSNIVGSVSGKHGGAICLRSSYMDIIDTVIKESFAKNNGGAIYVSYQSSREINSRLYMSGVTLEANVCEGSGGAIYATRRDLDDEWKILTAKDTDFISNSANGNGGALCVAPGVGVYLENTDFVSNSALGEDSSTGGAAFFNGSIVEINGAVFSDNSATKRGGAILLDNSASLVANAVVASGNSATGAGFAYLEDSALKLYASEIKNHSVTGAGGAIYAASGSSLELYGSVFESNSAEDNGGALFIYTGANQSVIQDCSFTSNSGNLGGAMYISNKSLVDIYNVTATANTAAKGGFMYETTSGTVVNLAGLTVSDNTATTGGPIIWGNTANAKLYIDKSQYTDLDRSGAYDDAYWSSAIYNLLTVEDKAISIPDYTPYVHEEPTPEPPAEEKPIVSVDEIFNLENSTTDGYINSTYDKFPKLDSSSNFMSDGVTVFENINGGTVTVDSFIYNTYAPDGNTNFGQGMLIYQAMLYKKAHPEEDVRIDISSYRFSVQAAVNLNRDSRYFGYMRNLVGVEYDNLGFVRIAYLLVSAAKMGIKVNVIGHIDAYPVSAGEPTFHEYFMGHLTTPCDPAYASGSVGDYLDFNPSYWTLEGKGGTDMMHTKMCAVSHYRDMNGTDHEYAVWTSSANLDGITSKGYNGNWKLQTGSIVAGHEYIYRVAVNYLALVAEYSAQEAIYELQDLMSRRSAEQMELILAGRGSEIPEDELIVYMGSEQDDVFEMYFTPFAGSTAVWDETYSPYAHYIREMYNSEGSIIFVWNAAEYTSEFPLGTQFEEMIAGAFHNNKNPENKFYGCMENFDISRLDGLTVGTDIGYLSFNKYPFGYVHNKDILISYVKEGQRYYVSLLNSCNMHSGSMYYQSNFMLVVKEKELTEDSVFFTMADLSTTGIVEHSYSEEELAYLPEDGSHGYYYRPCLYCDKMIVTGTIHIGGDWIIDIEAEPGKNGLKHKECTACGAITEVVELAVGEVELESTYTEQSGTTFTADPETFISAGDFATVRTFEAMISLSPDVSFRGGVVVGNYLPSGDDLVNIEIYTEGRVRLYYKVNGTAYYYLFNEDIRSDKPVHIAVTVDGRTASLYVNGELSQTLKIAAELPTSFVGAKIGGDNRSWNPQNFKGTIYSVSLFSDARDAREVARDAVAVTSDLDALLYTSSYTSPKLGISAIGGSGISFSGGDAISTGSIDGTPKTIEAIVSLPKDFTDRAGVVIGNYDGSDSSGLNLEIYTDGNPRLYYKSAGVGYSIMFPVNIRSDAPVHIAITVDGLIATLYVDGTIAAVAELEREIPETVAESFNIGDDMRAGSVQYFKGKIYAIGLYSDVRTEAEIARDAIVMADNEDALYLAYLRREVREEYTSGRSFTADDSIKLDEALEAAPRTLEAVLHVPHGMDERVGVIFGNYDGASDQLINFEIYDHGHPRLYIKNGDSTTWCTFATSINSAEPVHIAIVIAETEALLYVDGVFAEVQYTYTAPSTATSRFVVGGDNRYSNSQYFKGELYSLTVFSDIRSAKEIAKDSVTMSRYAQNVVYSEVFGETERDDKLDIYRPEDSAFGEIKTELLIDTEDAPKTLEATVQLSPSYTDRGGVIMGNYYGGDGDQINLEIYYGGKVRLFYVAYGERVDCLFESDIRSEHAVHIAVTVDGGVASLYVNGELRESMDVPYELPELGKAVVVGGDYRYENAQYFKGTIHSFAIFSDVRSTEEIRSDMAMVDEEADALLASLRYKSACCLPGAPNYAHSESDWIIDREATAEHNGVEHIECTECGKILTVREITNTKEDVEHIVYDERDAFKPTSESDAISIGSLGAAPKTFEFVFTISTDASARGGVLLGNYDGTNASGMTVEIYTNGNPRLYYKVGGVGYSIVFKTDVRSDKLTHMAITVDGMTASLYVNGEFMESAVLEREMPVFTEGFNLGNDRRQTSGQYFKGTIYAAHIFGDVRTAEEIALDAIKVMDKSDILYSEVFSR